MAELKREFYETLKVWKKITLPHYMAMFLRPTVG